MMFRAGEPVERDDGRFYVPVSRITAQDGVGSQVVLRVASDAFPGLAEAVAFAKFVEQAMNSTANDDWFD